MGLAFGDDLDVEAVGFEHQGHQVARCDCAPGEIAGEVPEVFGGVHRSNRDWPRGLRPDASLAVACQAPPTLRIGNYVRTPRAIRRPNPHPPASTAARQWTIGSCYVNATAVARSSGVALPITGNGMDRMRHLIMLGFALTACTQSVTPPSVAVRQGMTERQLIEASRPRAPDRIIERTCGNETAAPFSCKVYVYDGAWRRLRGVQRRCPGAAAEAPCPHRGRPLRLQRVADKAACPLPMRRTR